jgi:hypothetical protein
VQIVYAFHTHADHRVAHHILPEDVVEAIGWNRVDQIWKEDAHGYGMTWSAADAYAASEQGDYALYEAHALPLYLEYLFGQGQELFDFLPMKLSVLEEILVALLQHQHHRADTPRDERDVFAPALPSLETKTAWLRLVDAELVCVPSVLLLSSRHTVNEWFAALRLLEREAGVRVHPDLDVEVEIENKDRYLTAMMAASPQRSLPTPPSLGSVYPSTSADAAARPQVWQSRVVLHHVPHNRCLPPTVLLPAFHQVEEHLTRLEAIALLEDCMDRLAVEVKQGGWQVEPQRWIVKGTTSARGNAVHECSTAAHMLRLMRQMHHRQEDTGGAGPSHLGHQQLGFIIQPYLVNLALERRTYFIEDALICPCSPVVSAALLRLRLHLQHRRPRRHRRLHHPQPCRRGRSGDKSLTGCSIVNTRSFIRCC